MILIDIPGKYPVPWGYSAASNYIRAIPTASQSSVTPGAASLTDGFPPLCSVPVAAGGVPPFMQDFNGILQIVTAWQRWYQAGGPITYDSTFQSEIGGYPAYAVVRSTQQPRLFWLNTVDSNTTNPDSPQASGWVTFPPARGLAAFASSGSFTVPAGIASVRVRCWGAGGGGGGSLGANSNGSSGGGGGYAEGILQGLSPSVSVTVTVGIGGTGGSGATNGSPGGTSSFGSYMSATGGTNGYGANGNIQTTSAGTGGTGQGGTINLSGLSGGFGLPQLNSAVLSSVGGAAGFGFPPVQYQLTAGTVAGRNGNTACGGNGGLLGGAGGAGGNGFVTVDW